MVVFSVEVIVFFVIVYDSARDGTLPGCLIYAIAAAVALAVLLPCGLIQTLLAGLFQPWQS